MYELWEGLKRAKEYKWVELSHPLDNDSPFWAGIPEGSVELCKTARRKILCKRFSTKSRMALENRADSGLDPLITESHGGQNGMRAGTA